MQETVCVVCIQWIFLRCSPARLRLRGSVFSAAHSSKTENCLNMFICVTRAHWTRIAEKCFPLPTWHLSPAVDGPILIWGFPPFGRANQVAFKVRQRWLCFFQTLWSAWAFCSFLPSFSLLKVSLHWEHAVKENSFILIFFQWSIFYVVWILSALHYLFKQ